ncbi:putative aldouronate transport system substrate-binding protein [Paenibacillus sp. yr247]|uniref:extracellular solute-binding protein n=1 Tax=Paenibacillus sp. yr247 TaxID=1761880 RepID=UPI00087E2C3D|nr:extracellular solute-binding protein [Paenibacillus sp. yr247]SDN97198.1 putative aldouronate transport system substrate-binding protein [Paenibacillus sp. yr247]
MKLKLSIVLPAAVLILSASLAGCSSKSAQSTTDSTGALKDEKKAVETSIAFWDLADLNGDEYGKFIQDKFKLKVKPVTLSWDNWKNQLNTFAAAGDLPHFFANYGFGFEWQEQGLLRDIPDSILNKYPKIKGVIDNSPFAQAVKQMTGKNYFIPRPESLKNLYKAQQNYIYYRSDWMQNVGITKPPETMDEYYQMLKAFKEKDPDKNGANDTIGLVLNGKNYNLFPMFGIDPSKWVQEEGKWIPAYLSPKNIEALKFYQKLYKEGILDPEYLKLSHNEAIGKLAQNKAGSLVRNADTMWYHTTLKAFGDANPGKDPLNSIAILPPLKKDSSSKPSAQMTMSDGGTMISAQTSDQELDRVLEMMNWMMTPEGLDFRHYGIEGKDYKKEGDKFVPITTDLTKKYKSYIGLVWLADWDFDSYADVNLHQEIPAKYKEQNMADKDKYNAAVLKENVAITILPTPAKLKLAINWQDSFAQIITSKEDVEASFDKFIDDSKKKGVDKAIEEVNQKAAQMGLK